MSRQNVSRREVRVTYLGWGGLRRIEWRLTRESAERFAADCVAKGWSVLSIEEAEHLLDY